MDYEGNNNKDNNLNNKITNTFNTLIVSIDPNTLLNKNYQHI